MSTSSAVLSLQSLWVLFPLKPRESCQASGCYLNPNWMAGLGSCLESWRNWDGGDERIDRRDNTLAMVSEPDGEAFSCCYYFAKENNQTKEYSVICKLS